MGKTVYEELFPKPKSHREYMEGFNIRGKIIRVLINKEDKE